MNQVLLGLGSNLNTPQRQLQLCILALRALPQSNTIAIAPFYPNPAFGRKKQPSFLNTVVHLQTRLSALKLLRSCQEIEQQLKRTRGVKNAARTIDVDILYYGRKSLQHPRLVLPHPGAQHRPSVLVPLQSLLTKGSRTSSAFPHL